MIEIKHDNNKVKKLFDNNYKKMIPKVGLDLTKTIKKRISQIKASSSFYAYLQTKIGKPERLSGADDNKYSIHLSANYRLIVQPITTGFDREDLLKCDSIYVKGVVDYHGDKENWIFP